MNIEGLFLRTVWKIKNTNILSTKSYCNNFLCIALFFVYSRFYGKCECSRCGGFSSRSVIYSQAWACLHGVCVQLETGKRLWRQETCKSSRLVPGVCCHDLCAVRAIFVTVDQNASNIVKSLIFYFHPSIFVIKKKKAISASNVFVKVKILHVESSYIIKNTIYFKFINQYGTINPPFPPTSISSTTLLLFIFVWNKLDYTHPSGLTGVYSPRIYHSNPGVLFPP